MSKFNMSIRQRGFGMLEVLIAILVLSVGMLSLGSLHSMIIKSSSASKARSTAAMLAQEKLDDLVSYEQLSSGGTGTFGFNEIASNSGGRECDGVTVTTKCPTGTAAGTLEIPSGNTTSANVSYNRTWAVQDYYFCSENSAPSTSNTCLAPNPNFKLVTMSVTWDEPGTGPGCTNGTCPRAVSLQSVVAAISPASSGQSAITGGRGSPTVNYTPGTAPDVIPINLGDNTKKEATKPTPDITQHGTSTITTFDEITYNTVLNTKRRDNFFTVNCVCSQNGVPGTTDAKGYLPTTFDGTQYVIPASTTASKRTGSTFRQGQLGEQPKLCDICCRDHHDLTAPSTSTPSSFDTVYDPFRPLTYVDVNGVTQNSYDSSGDHKHFYVDNSGNVIDANNSGAQYFEACRMVLVGGSPWVLQDWKLEAHQIMPSSFLTSNVSTYTTYVATFIEQFLRDSGTSSTSTTYPITTPTASHGTTNPNINSTVVSALASLPTTQSMNIADTSQYVGRGIYIDYMSPTLRKTIRCKIDPSLETGCTNTAAETYLPFVPFHEVNLTRLAEWTPTQDTVAQVTSTAISNGNETTYGRGLVTAIGAGTRNITSTIGKSNTGLTAGSNDVDPDDSTNTSDSIAVTVSSSSSSSSGGSTSSSSSSGSTSSSGSGNITISGSVTNTTNVNIAAGNLFITGGGNAACNFTNSSMPKVYTCTFTGAGAGTIAIYGYSKTSGNKNNCLSPYSIATGLPAGTTLSVAGSGDTETTTFSFVSGLSTMTLNFNIKVDSNSNSGSCP